MDERESIISDYICGEAMAFCNCPGENGADTDTALCWNLARRIMLLPVLDRMKMAKAIAPEIEAS